MTGNPTSFAAAADQTRKAWASRVIVDTIAPTHVGSMISDGILVRKDDLTRDGGGDTVYYNFLARLTNKGIRGSQSATGNEQALSYSRAGVLIDQMRNAVSIKAKGTIDAQRAGYLDLDEDTYKVLKMWYAERIELCMFNQLAGNTAVSITDGSEVYTGDDRLLMTGLNPAIAPSANQILRPNSLSTDEAVTADSTATLKLTHVDECVMRARTNRSYIMPLEGKHKFKFYVHYSGFYQLIQDPTAPIQYRDLLLAKISSGVKDEELIGESFPYNDTLIIATDKIPYGVHSSTSVAQTNTRRAVFCGKNAGAIAFGKGYTSGDGKSAVGFDFKEDMVDIGNIKRIAISGVWGGSKTVFNSRDHGTIVVPHYAA